MCYVWAMRWIIFFLLLSIGTESYSQLVRRKDYDAAFSLQTGIETGTLTSFHHARLSLKPTFGIKITFPFTRKWFLGSEINYSDLKYSIKQNRTRPQTSNESSLSLPKEQVEFDLKQIQIPIYLKYRLNCNKASVLFGFYGSYIFDSKFNISSPVILSNPANALANWNAGITIGYEHQLIKHLNVMCRVSTGMKKTLTNRQLWDDKLFPIQASLTLSYDIFRIGDCGCD